MLEQDTIKTELLNVRRESQQKSHDIDFLNHQCYNLDISFQNALSEIQTLKAMLHNGSANGKEETEQKAKKFEERAETLEL